MKYLPRRPRTNVNVTPTSPLRDFFFMLGGLILALMVTYALLGVLVDFIALRISPAMERNLSGFLGRVNGAVPSSSAEGMALQMIVDKMQQQCIDLPYTLQVEVADSDLINALALPGGRIVVFSGLLEEAQSENELVFVLSHEMGHFFNRDHLSGLGRGLVFMLLSVSIFGPDSMVGEKIGSLLKVSEFRFSRKHETMADEYALDALNCYYGHVAGATSFFKHTSTVEEKKFTGHYLSTHPLSDQRIARLVEWAEEKGFKQTGELVPFMLSETVHKD